LCTIKSSTNKINDYDQPYIKKDGKLIPVDWNEALTVAAKKLRSTKPNKIAAIAGDLADCESMLLLKEMMHKLKTIKSSTNKYLLRTVVFNQSIGL
jgi:NADH dehydrogenase/NADH:ubiquinone oxidoreductase subunit G